MGGGYTSRISTCERGNEDMDWEEVGKTEYSE